MPGEELVREQVRLDPAEPREDRDELKHERQHQRRDDRPGAVARDRREHQADRGDPEDRNEVDEEARADQDQAVSGADGRPGKAHERVEARDDRPTGERHDGHRDERDERVRAGRERLAGENRRAVERAGQDGLERPVVVLRGDDVAGNERRDQREEPVGAEGEQDERHREPGLEHVPAEGDVLRAVVPRRDGRDEDGRDGGGEQEADVGALLGEQLPELPAVDGEGARHQLPA